jgi:hypothetical protein
MDTVAELYNQNQLYSPDDIAHSSQRNKGTWEIDWSKVAREKNLLERRAKKRGTDIGSIYAQLDQRYLGELLCRRPSKKK